LSALHDAVSGRFRRRKFNAGERGEAAGEQTRRIREGCRLDGRNAYADRDLARPG
jgi:hypothetical protein